MYAGFSNCVDVIIISNAALGGYGSTFIVDCYGCHGCMTCSAAMVECHCWLSWLVVILYFVSLLCFALMIMFLQSV